MICKFIPFVKDAKGRKIASRALYQSVCIKEEDKYSHYQSINAIYAHLRKMGFRKDDIRVYSDKGNIVRCERYIESWNLIFNIKVLSKNSILYDTSSLFNKN